MGTDSEGYDAKWGRFLPSQHFNVDQSPMPFVVDSKKHNKLLNRYISMKKHG